VSVFVIAEAGVNHNGSLDLALELVDVAAAAGADAVKFQTFRAAALATAGAGKAAYQERTTGEGSQRAMLERLELDEAAHRALADRAEARGIEFMSAPFDHESLDLLVRLGVRRLKLGSGELTNGPLLEAAARTGLPLILSTGMATLEEVTDAVRLVRAAGAADVTVLHCTTEYPAPPGEVNLRAIATMREALGVPVGYSDHTIGVTVTLAAVALGASVIEKHFTTDRTLPGPDHPASLEPAELAELVSTVRTVEEALGDGVKRPTASELPNLAVARKSLVAASPIAAGEAFTTANVAVKRPGTGISPMRIRDVLSRTASRDYAADELLDVAELPEADR
jgi:N-acetylneuraminate synthase